MVVYLARERDVYFVAVEASYAESAFSLMYRTYPRVLTRVTIVRSTNPLVLNHTVVIAKWSLVVL